MEIAPANVTSSSIGYVSTPNRLFLENPVVGRQIEKLPPLYKSIFLMASQRIFNLVI